MAAVFGQVRLHRIQRVCDFLALFRDPVGPLPALGPGHTLVPDQQRSIQQPVRKCLPPQRRPAGRAGGGKQAARRRRI